MENCRLLFQQCCHNSLGHLDLQAGYASESNRVEAGTRLHTHHQCVIWDQYPFSETVSEALKWGPYNLPHRFSYRYKKITRTVFGPGTYYNLNIIPASPLTFSAERSVCVCVCAFSFEIMPVCNRHTINTSCHLFNNKHWLFTFCIAWPRSSQTFLFHD